MKRLAFMVTMLLLATAVFAQVNVTGHVYAVSPTATVRAPVAGATVTLLPMMASTMPPVARYTATTGRDGSYAIANVVAGSYCVMATARGFTQATRVTITIPRASSTTRGVVADVMMVPVRTSTGGRGMTNE